METALLILLCVAILRAAHQIVSRRDVGDHDARACDAGKAGQIKFDSTRRHTARQRRQFRQEDAPQPTWLRWQEGMSGGTLISPYFLQLM